MDNQNQNTTRIVQGVTNNLAIVENNEIKNMSKKLGFWLFFVSIPLIIFSSFRLFSILAALKNGGSPDVFQLITALIIPITLFVFGIQFRRAKMKLSVYKKLTIATIVLCSISIFLFYTHLALGFFMIGFAGLGCNNGGGVTCAIAWGGVIILVTYCVFQIYVIVQCFIKCVRLLSLLKGKNMIS